MTHYLESDFDINSDKLVEVFDELNLWAAPFGLKLLENISYHKEITALDIGCGAGFPLTEVAMRLGNTCRVIGIDPWEAALRRAEKKIKRYGISNTRIISGVAENLPLDDDSIDLITSNNGLNNVSDLDLSIKECARVLKKRGQLVMTMNLDGTMNEFYSILSDILVERGMEEEIGLMDEHIYQKRKPVHEVTAILEKHNLSIRHILYDNFTLDFADGTAMFNHYTMRLGFLSSWKKIIPEAQQQEIFQIIEQRLNEQASFKGHLSLSVPFVLIDCRYVD
jgi:arsenite methyltransferase